MKGVIPDVSFKPAGGCDPGPGHGRSASRCLRAIPAFVLIAGMLAVAPQSVELQRLRNEGMATFEEQRFADAVAAFADVLDDPGAVPQDHLNLALAEYRAGDDEAALQTLADAGELLDAHPGAAYLRGLVARRTGELEEAREAFERTRELDPTDPAVRYNLGAVYAELGLQELALAELEAVIAMGFDLALQHQVSALYQRSQLLLRQGRRQEAEEGMRSYAEGSRRLSAAARTRTALEQSRSIAVRVPDTSLVEASPETAAQVRFEEASGVELTVASDGGPAAVADLNLDGLTDWLITGPEGSVWLSGPDGYEMAPLPSPAGITGIGDFDRDGWPDLYVASAAGDRLFRNLLGDAGRADGGAAFAPVAAEGLPAASAAATSVLWVDFDHDGDLDLLLTGEPRADGEPEAGGESSFPRLLRNLGGGAFVDATATSGLAGAGAAKGALWVDFDGDYDVDLLFWGAAGSVLYSNERGGRFTEIGAAAGAGIATSIADALAEDLDNDGRIDLLVATGVGIAARRNLPGGTFATVEVEALAGLRAEALAAADYNNDGYLDLVVAGDEGLRFFANAGGFDFAPFAPLADGSSLAEAGPAPPLLRSSDLDGNGGADLLIERQARIERLLQPRPLAGWLTVGITGIKNNLQGIGATVEVKAGGSYQLRPLRAAPLHFGVGAVDSVDVVRIRWPNGIVQNLFDVAAGQRLEVTELERLEGSCPFLYTWNGDRWLFANEVLGAAPLGMLLAEGVFHSPDPDEYVFVAGEDLQPLDGGYEIRVTEELRETSYLDAVRILAVDHPPSLSVLPDEGFGGPPRPGLRLRVHEGLQPVRAVDQEGRDWSASLAAVDGDWAVPFEPGAYDGLATPHTLTLELPEISPVATPVYLYLTGWVYWSMGSVNLAIDQDPAVEFTPVSLDVPDGRGGWRTAIEDIGLPIAKNTTLTVDVGALLDRADPRVRLRTTMRLYWDAARYGEGGPHPGGLVPVGDWQQEHGVPRSGILELRAAGGDGDLGQSPSASEPPVRVQVLAPTAAELRPRGFSKLSRTPEGYETFDYQTVLASAPWEQHRGLYTRFGEVGELLDAADDRYVVLGTGDEVAIRFEAPLAPPPPGWRRDFLIYLHGWLKDTDLNTAYGDRVEPLPFHGMSSYPYPPPEHYPDDEAHREFVEHYLTRGPRPINPPLGGQR
jgi:hypothetical protein